ncbi:hypothetical protein GIB67_014956 [Kingdonia uniflora]|uniref:PX domain-containing protein n=1 Tax=Kingdonia uniflora TaxID=39325 RepID=A0A7J7MTM7_9MAGN|nr:hypothetical protein GIB67_014956 [Kingdonia uniflora]
MMMNKQMSPPKHRHDGSSPLPLGMDWSSPPKKWDGRDTIWPHDPRSGWSYCVTIPSWVILPKSRQTEGVVFYRVQVGIQSPEGISTTRGVLRRFSDFMKLFTEVSLKKAYSKKSLPPAPSKHVLRINSTRSLPDEVRNIVRLFLAATYSIYELMKRNISSNLLSGKRRCSLEEWMRKLLSDIDLSRSVPVASFLELEAAARSSFHDVNQQNLEAKPSSSDSSAYFQLSSGISVVGGSSSLASDYGSDHAYEISEIGTPRQEKDNSSEAGTEDFSLDQDLTTTLVKLGISNNTNGLFVRDSILEQLEGFPTHKLHARKLSVDSVGSDISSIRDSEVSNTGVIANSLGDETFYFGGADTSTSRDFEFPGDIQIVIPLDQRHKLNRVLMTMQRRLATAKTDMEDLIARLNQEIAVKEYLTTKVKDLEIELEITQQKSKENLQQTILIERERFTQLQWDMEELRRESLEMESKLKAQQDEKLHTESTKTSAVREKEYLAQELDSTKEKLANLQNFHQELLMKSKADTKVLVKEVKSLRNSQTELKQELGRSFKENSELERVLQKEKQRTEHAKNARGKLLHECGILRHRLQECSVNFLAGEEDKFTVDSSLSDALDLLTTSDNRIGLLLAEAQLLAQDEETSFGNDINGDDLGTTDNEIRKMLTDLFIDNARLRKQVNSVIRCALKATITSENSEEETPSRKTVLNKFLER